MMKALTKLKPRERRFIAAAGVLIGCWLAVAWLIEPLVAHVQQLERQIAHDQVRLDAMRRLFARAPEITRRHQELAAYLAAVEPSEEQQRSFLTIVQETCSQLNLQPSLKPRMARSPGEADRLEVELAVEGPQEQVLSLLDALFRLPRLVTIQELRLLSVASKADTVRATIVLQDLAVHPL